MTRIRLGVVSLWPLVLLLVGTVLFAGPGGGGVFRDPLSGGTFLIKHLRERPGEQITETMSYVDVPGLDNGSGTTPLQVLIEFERYYGYQINERLTSDEISGARVRDMITGLYRLPPNDLEVTIQAAVCPVSIVIPPGKKAIITVEWTEQWAEGVIVLEESGNQIGTYSVFLGYGEPCDLIAQENVE